MIEPLQNPINVNTSVASKSSEDDDESYIIEFDFLMPPIKKMLVVMKFYFGIAAAFFIVMLFQTAWQDPGSLVWLCMPPLLLISMLLFINYYYRRKFRIVLDKSGIAFPRNQLSATLLNRLERSWDDLHSVQLTGFDNSAEIIWRDSEQAPSLEKRLAKLSFDSWQRYPAINFDFKSGGSTAVFLILLEKKQGEQLFRALETWCDPAKFSAEVVRLEKAILLEADAASTTRLWQDDLNASYAATNYVPLRMNHKLQSGRFKVLMELAAGGMSAIYVAEDTGTGRKVVLKEAVPPFDADEKQREKAQELFERESALLVKLNHPQIARVLDHFIEAGRDYLVLEYIPGKTLRQLVKMEGKQDQARVLDWSRQICDILIYLHGQDPPIIHRDLTPDNLILGEDGKVFLVDFGAANEFVGNATGTLIGKQCYISPEQLRGKAVPQSDLYSLGGTLHFLLTGSDPVPLCQSHPMAVLNTVSQPVDDLVARLTAFDCRERFSTAEEFAETLNKLAPGLKTTPRKRI